MEFLGGAVAVLFFGFLAYRLWQSQNKDRSGSGSGGGKNEGPPKQQK